MEANSKSFSRSSPRSRGAVDSTDLTLGFILLLSIPALMYISMEGFGPRTRSDMIDRGLTPKLDPIADVEEVQARLKVAEDLSLNAKKILSLAEKTSDPIKKEHLRGWASKAIRSTDQYLGEVGGLLRKDPESEKLYSDVLGRVEALRREAESDHKRVAALDALGRESPLR